MAAPPWAPGRPEVSTPFEMTFGRPVPQRRVTVLFRPILAIPQLVVLYFLNIAASVLVFLGWFAALFTGRLPDSFASFILGFLRWRARVDAYLFLMTDTYPPFSLQPEPAYPIDVAVQTGRLNRLAVLFRYFIAIPAALAVGLLYFGLGIFWIVTWVATLVKGEVPAALFEANAAALRYAYRLQAYFVMLTSFYPAEVMGDAGLSGPAAAPPMPQPPPPPFGYPPVSPAAVPDADPGPSATIRTPPPPPPPPPHHHHHHRYRRCRRWTMHWPASTRRSPHHQPMRVRPTCPRHRPRHPPLPDGIPVGSHRGGPMDGGSSSHRRRGSWS